MDSYHNVIWLVDDDLEDQNLIKHAFRGVQPPISIVTLNDGDELIPALEMAQSWPLLIMLDLNMTRMDGLQTLTALQNYPTFQKIPVIVLTTSTNPRDQELSQQLGAKAYHVKPFHFSEMTTLARNLVEQWIK